MGDEPRVALLTRSLEVGGTERQVVLLARRLHERGVPVLVVSFYGGAFLGDLERAGVPVELVGKRGRWDQLGFARRLRRVLRRFDPAVVYAFLNGPNLVSLVTPGRRRRRIVWGVRSTDVDLAVEDRFVRLSLQLEALASRWADLIICNSAAGRDDAARRGMPADRLVVIPNGIDTEAFAPQPDAAVAVRHSWGIEPGAPLVGLVGRLHPMKGHDAFVDVAARVAAEVPDARFVVVGADPEGRGPALLARASAAGLDGRLQLVGDRRDVPAVLSALDVVVSASTYGEGFSNVLGEAMACGTACVATDVGDAAAIVGDLGVVVPIGDVRALADGVVAELQRDPPERAARAAARRARVVERFGLDALAGSTLAAATEGPVRDGPVRVVHVITGLDVGGAETALVKLLAARDPERVDPVVVSLRDRGVLAPQVEAAGVPVVALGMHGGVADAWRFVTLVRELRARRPDVVQTWLYKADLVGGLASLLAQRPPLVWSIRQSQPERASRSNRAVAAVTARLSGWLPDRIVCVGEEARRGHAEAGYDAGRMVVIGNGFDTDRFRPDPEARRAVRAELGVGEAPVVGHVARWDPQKDYPTLLRAAARVVAHDPAVRFVLVGDGILAGQPVLDHLIAELGLADAVALLSRRSDVARVDAALDVAVSSSIGEGFSNAIGEAMACGVPCVATDVGNAADLIGDTGVVVAPADPAALADALVEVLGRGPDERRRLGSEARQRIIDRFGLDTVVAAHQALYEEVRHVRDRRAR